MTTCKPFADDTTQVPVRLKDVWRADRWVLLLSTGVCIFLAIKLNLVAGDPVSVLWKYPLSYRDDGLACLQTMRKLMDGWLLYASRAGYPMGASFHDYPMSDLGSLVILKLLGMLTGSPVASVNTFYILGYPAASVCAHLVLRLLGMRTWPAVVCSLLFALLPFHFLRIEHLFLTWYFQVPIYVYAAYRVWRSGPEDSPWSMSRSALSLWLLLLATLSGFGLYYAFFGAMLICIGALLGWLRGGQWRPVWLGGLFVVAISAGLAANVLPNQILNPYGSPNPEAVQRAAFETEYNGLKLTQLFVPHIHHRSAYLKTVAETYARDFPLSTENHTASLGMVGAAGVLLLLYHMARAFARPDPGDVQRFLAAGFLALFLFATIGGLSTPFSSIVSPVIRCTNRVSVFLGFLALASVFFTWQRAFPGAGSAIPRTYRWAGAALLVVLFLLGGWDQSPKLLRSAVHEQHTRFEQDERFIQAIQASLPPQAAVFQLPYMPYPESPKRHNLETYALSIGYTHSTTLNWSYGGMRGRPEDAYARQVSTRPIGQLARDVVAHGFSGLYIDRRGYADGGKQIEQELRDAMGPLPSIVHPAGYIVFYRLVP